MTHRIYIPLDDRERGIWISYVDPAGSGDDIRSLAAEINDKARAAQEFYERNPEGLLVQMHPAPAAIHVGCWEGIAGNACADKFLHKEIFVASNEDVGEDVFDMEGVSFRISLDKDGVKFETSYADDDGYDIDMAAKVSFGKLTGAFLRFADARDRELSAKNAVEP